MISALLNIIGGTDYQNILSMTILVISLIFSVPLGILVCVQTKNMMQNETTSERFGRKKNSYSSNQDNNPTPDKNFGSSNIVENSL